MDTLIEVDEIDAEDTEEFDEIADDEIENLDEEDETEDESDDEALFSFSKPVEIKRPFTVAEIFGQQGYDLADDELKEQFDKLYRFCPCCGRPQKRGSFCWMCTHDVTHHGDRAYFMSNGGRGSECVYAQRYSWHILTEHSLIKHRHGRTYQIFGWRLAFIEEKRRIRSKTEHGYYAGVKIDNHRLSITSDPDFVPLPEYEVGKVTGLRKILNIERVYTPEEIHFDPQRPAPERPVRRTLEDNAPKWYRSAGMTHHYNFFGHEVFIQFEPAPRDEGVVVRTGLVYGSATDYKNDLACAQVGDRIGSEFGPKIVEVSRGRKRDLQKLPAHHTGITRGSICTVARFEIARLEDFDPDVLRAAVAAEIRETAESYHRRDGDAGPSAQRTLERFNAMTLQELVATAPADPDPYSDWGRYLKGYSSLVDALASLACELVRCPDCEQPEARHHGPIPCGYKDEPETSDVNAGPQLALF